MTKLTTSEAKALQGIMDSDFQDGCKEAGKPVWTWSANPFASKRTFSGVVASLNKKGLTGSTDEGEDSVIWITEAGLEALLSQKKEIQESLMPKLAARRRKLEA
jgi:hypothetical protein